MLYLDDDNLFASDTAAADILAAALSGSRDRVLLWRSRLGRLTPSDANFGRPRIERGDVDASSETVNACCCCRRRCLSPH